MIANTMQQFTFVAANKFEWREVRTPKVSASQHAIVRPLAVTRCDLDLYIADGTLPMKDSPFAFGHEIAGEVIDVGEGVADFLPGNKVIVPFQINCGACDHCKRGFTNACSSVPAYSAYGLAQSSGKEWGGGLSDYVLVPYADAMLVKIPDGISLPVAAAISDNASDGYRTVADPLVRSPCAEVLVVGGLARSVGLFAVQAAISLGASRVVYRDFDPERLAHAKRLGAEVVETQYHVDIPAKEQFPIVVDASNIREGLLFALKSTAPCGVCTGISAPGKSIDNVPFGQMYMKGITFSIGRVHARAEIDAVLDCARCGQINHDEIITRKVQFSDAAEAITEPDTKIVFLANDQRI